VAGHDHPVAAVGAGAVGPDDLFDSCGTAEALVRATNALPGRQTRQALAAAGVTTGRHVVGEGHLLLGATRGGLLLDRVLGLLGAGERAERVDLDARAVGLLGRRHGVRLAGGSVSGDEMVLTLTGDELSPEHLWAAVLEHTARLLAGILDHVVSEVGEPRRAVAAGGWTRLAGYRAVKQTVLPDVVFHPEDEPGGRGAALLAAVAARGEDPEIGVRSGFGG
jgi:sugar (pentulose or hexulose) kinase